jgi:hypothetical protein
MNFTVYNKKNLKLDRPLTYLVVKHEDWGSNPGEILTRPFINVLLQLGCG